MSGRKTAPFIMIQNVANAAVQLAIVIIISRALGAEGAGHYALAQSYVMPAFFLGLFALKTQYLIAREPFDIGDLWGVRTIAASVIFLIVVCIALIAENTHIALIVLALSCVKFFDGYIDTLIGIFQKSGALGFIAKTAISRLIISMGAFTLVFFATRDTALSLFTMAGAGFLHFFVIEQPWCRKNCLYNSRIFDFSPAATTTRMKLAKDGLPIALGVLIGAAQLSVVRILLENYHGAALLGQFSAALQVVLIGNLFIVATGQAFMPMLAAHFQQNNRKAFKKIILMLMGFITLCVCAGTALSFLIGNWLMEFIFGTDFKNLGWMLVIASASSLPFFMNAVLNQAAIACNLAYAQFKVYLTGFIIACVLGWYLTAHYDTNGAYAAIFITNIVQCAAFLALISKRFRQQ